MTNIAGTTPHGPDQPLVRHPEVERSIQALHAVQDAAAAMYGTVTGGQDPVTGAQIRPGVDAGHLAVTGDYDAALDYLDRAVHSAPAEYVAEAAARFARTVTDASAVPELDTALTAVRAALQAHYAAEADVAAMLTRNRTG